MKRLLLLLGFIVLMMLPSVGATTLTALYPSGTSGSPTVISRSDPFNFTVRVTNYNEAHSDRYLYARVVGMPLTKYYAVSIHNVSVTANGTYTLSFDRDQIPFDQQKCVVAYFLLNSTTPFTAPFAMSTLTGYFSVNGIAATWTHLVSLKGFDPFSYDLQALHVMKQGFRWGMTANATETVYILLCDGNTRGLIAYGTRSASYTNNGTLLSIDKGFTWIDYQGKTSSGNKSFYIPRSPYYEYVGVRTDDGSHSWTNTRVTMLDGTGVGGNTRELNFSINDFNLGTPLYHNSVAKNFDFQGYFTYFETMSASGESINIPGVSHTGASWLVGLNLYFTSFGMGWMMYLLGFIVVCCFVGPTYAFARRFNISIPNFIYVLMIIVSVTAAWIIGFFDTWIYVFFVIIVMLSIVIKYRESIEQAIGFAGAEVGEFKAGEERIGKPFRTAVKEYGVRPVRKRLGQRIGLKGFVQDEGSMYPRQTVSGIGSIGRAGKNLALAIGGAGQTNVKYQKPWRYTKPGKKNVGYYRGKDAGFYGKKKKNSPWGEDYYNKKLKGGN